METTQPTPEAATPTAPETTAETRPEKRGPLAPVHRVIGTLEHGLARGGDALWRAFKHRPALGVSAATLAGLGLASTIGASELAIAFAAGVAAYQMLKKNEPPSRALEDAAKFGL